MLLENLLREVKKSEISLVLHFNMATPEENIIEKLESEIDRLNLEIFELKGALKITKGQLKEATLELQKQQGYFDDDGNYVE